MALPARRRAATTLANRDPWGDLEQTARRMNDMFEQVFGTWPTVMADEGFSPMADLEETDDAYRLEIELPGVAKDDIDIEIKGRRISISGERKDREREGVLRRTTRSTGRFFYEAVLPGELDDERVSADLSDGVLSVTIPKAEQERRHSRKVEIR